MCRRRGVANLRIAALAVVAALTVAGGLDAQVPYGDSDRFTSPDPLEVGGWEADNFEVVGYTDMDGHIPFKITMQGREGRWYLYGGNFWTRGWSITDVTDPARPELLRIIEAPGAADNSSTVQMDWAGERMVVGLSAIGGGRDFDPSRPYAGGFYIFDLEDPVDPRLLGHWESVGTHRNYYDDGQYVHATAEMEGYEGQIYVIVDVSDPTNPFEAGRWWGEGQHVAGGESFPEGVGNSMHGPAMPVGDLVYLSYGNILAILDISDPTSPMEVGRLAFTPPFLGGALPGAGISVHSVLPLPERGIAIVNSEAIAENCQEPLNHVSIVDISDPSNPTLISIFPVPEPPPGSPFSNFCEKGGRFGPHNLPNIPHSNAAHEQGDILFLTYFNAGVRAYDISNPRLPKEVGYFIPPDPFVRYGPLPRTRLVTQTQDVFVDRRGYIYITDRNHGVWILRYTGPGSDTL